jgi:DNA-binding NtrC family response regulator
MEASMRRILLVLGRPDERTLLSRMFLDGSWDVSEASSRREALHLAREGGFDLLLADALLRDGRGMDLLPLVAPGRGRALFIVDPGGSLPPGMVTLERPLEVEDLEELLTLGGPVQRATARIPGGATHRLSGSKAAPPRRARGRGPADLPDPDPVGPLVGVSPAMVRLREQIRRMGPAQAGVFISGETGSGKEVVAQALHHASGRSRGPFVAVNCGAISPSLVESELFGHERGSFTGATRQHAGVFQQASGGTLLLDEITEMPLALQVRLLRVLEMGEVVPVGGEQAVAVDCRVLAACNRDPVESVRKGILREDLYYRLNILHIRIPPLRERLEDILLLARHFLGELAGGHGVGTPATPEWDETVCRLLEGWPWPGNCRELRNVMEGAFCLAGGARIRPEHLPDELRSGKPSRSRDGGALRILPGTTVEEAERRLILATLEDLQGHKTRAARMLGISLKTLYNRLHTYGYPIGTAVGEDEAELRPA